jgi:plastocyanin
MSNLPTKRRAMAGLVLAAAVSLAILLPIVSTSGSESVREINLVVRDMSFYLDGRGDPNPTIVLRAGERVTVRVRNEDAGMRHDFSIKAWSVGTRMLEDRGEEDAVTFRVPDARGTGTYTCTPHPKMMSGTLRVE